MNLLVTGGCGFIGSNFINHRALIYGDTIVNLDALTYAADKNNILPPDVLDDYTLIEGDISDADLVANIMQEYEFDAVVNFAAESHVDRSINNSDEFIKTNIVGTHNLLTNYKLYCNWQDKFSKFVHVSTDEVYGDLHDDDPGFTEEHQIQPNSPYSASKASSDLLCRSFYKTYNLPVVVTRCCNNYGPNQHVEKLIPAMITKAVRDEPLPVYGTGENIREWIHVQDHCEAISTVLANGDAGQVYNIGGTEEIRNIDLVKLILKHLDKPESLIEFVEDRKGHDWRYAIDDSKIEQQLNWKPFIPFETGLKQTVEHYVKLVA